VVSIVKDENTLIAFNGFNLRLRIQKIFMIRVFFFGVIILMFAACADDAPSDRKDGYSQTSRSPEDSLFQEVMDGHDVAMAKQSKLLGYRKEVDKKLDSLKNARSPSKASQEKIYISLGTELKNAEDHMNTWMQEFIIDSAENDTKRRLEYLQSEKLKVLKVKEEILEAVGRADSVLGKR
jgi:hypothetical protein